MTFVLIAVFTSYAFLVVCLCMGWRRAINGKSGVRHQDQFTSIIVPLRNEEANIGFLLENLFSQNFPADKFEIIIVDDYSEDNTVTIVEEKLKTTSSLNCRIIQSTGHGKKTAITTGVQQSAGDLIVTTDADCRVKPNWLQSIHAAFVSDSIKMVFGPVKIESDQSFFSTLQSLEFSSLIGSGAATLTFGTPTMCNGANLAFRKEIFREVGGYEGNEQVASGDDEFLMRKIAKKYPGGISFNDSQNSIVITHPQETLSQFISQRLRWAGKWKHHQDFKNKLFALYIFIFHAMVLSLPVLYVTGRLNGYEVTSLILLKLIVEYIFLYRVTSWLSIRWHWPSFIFLQLLYSVYAVGIGFTSLFLHPSWKGRK